MREPIEEIFLAAELLDKAADEHLAENHQKAAELIRAAEIPAIRSWTESLWGNKRDNPDQQLYRRYRKVNNSPLRAVRLRERMPSRAVQNEIIKRYGRHCVFCGIPLISADVRKYLRRFYPDDLSWGDKNPLQHAAFQCMWLQFDHILPHSRGGDNSVENVVPTCAGCNFGKDERTLEEHGLIDPRAGEMKLSTWDGLERVRLKRK